MNDSSDTADASVVDEAADKDDTGAGVNTPISGLGDVAIC
jgi:hypothetical protein